jgi:hypothetical protein
MPCFKLSQTGIFWQYFSDPGKILLTAQKYIFCMKMLYLMIDAVLPNPRLVSCLVSW